MERRRDTVIFGSRYRNDETGCLAYDPKILLKVILFAYARGIMASLKAESASLFRAVLLLCAEHDLLGGTPLALAGVKLPSNAA